MKHTAVEQLQVYLSISLGRDRMRMLFNEFEKAKEMEKEQIIKAYWEAYKESQYSGDKTAEEYYNETYKNTEQ
jgi:hypothetical protein